MSRIDYFLCCEGKTNLCHPSSILMLCVYTQYNLFAHSSCTSLFILLFIKSTVLHILLYIYIFSCVVLHILHCPMSGPDLIYISLLIISCIFKYVTNKKILPLNLGCVIPTNEDVKRNQQCKFVISGYVHFLCTVII